MIGTIGVVGLAIMLGALGLWMDHANRKSMKQRDGEKDGSEKAHMENSEQ